MLKPTPANEIPEETVRIAQAAFPKGHQIMRFRDEFGTLYTDADFANLFPARGQPALAPWRLALTTVFQFLENLTDRQAANAVRGRLEWKYALGLELTDPGFDFSVLCEFRSRLIAGNAEQLLLDTMLEHFGRKGLVKARGTQRTDSTHVLASVRTLNRLELVTETMRATLNALSTVAPDWLQSFARAEWLERYGRRVEEYWLPKGKAAREEFALRIGEDGYALLDAIDALALETEPALATDPALETDPTLEKIRTLTWLRDVPMVSTLRQAWAQQFERIDGQAKWRTASNFPPASQRFDSPYDTDTHYSLKRDFGWSGYKTHLTETCDSHAPHVITNVETTHSTVPDVNATEDIHLRLEHRQLLPALHVVDSGYADSDAFVNNKLQRDVTLVGPLGVDPSWQARAGRGFDLSGFEIDWQDKRVTCPQGKVATRWCESKATKSKSKMTSESTAGATVINVKFEHEDCFACQMRVYCTRTVRKPRQLSFRPKAQHEELQASRTRLVDADWDAIYDKRAGVEGCVSEGVRAFGLRRARYRGLVRTRLQHVVVAAAMNVSRVVAWLEGARPVGIRVSRFGALMRAA